MLLISCSPLILFMHADAAARHYLLLLITRNVAYHYTDYRIIRQSQHFGP